MALTGDMVMLHFILIHYLPSDGNGLLIPGLKIAISERSSVSTFGKILNFKSYRFKKKRPEISGLF
jgi:hypothetical protein